MMFLFGLLACSEEIIPDGIWDVKVTGLETTCIEALEGFQESYRYEAYYEGSYVELDINGESFAKGQRRGCLIEYTSATYLENSADGDFRWNIEGRAESQGTAGGCDIQEGLDWFGTETLTVVDSDNESISEFCTYEMTVTGTYIGQ